MLPRLFAARWPIAGALAALAAMPAPAAIVTISYTGVTSAGGADTQYQDFLAGTNTYVRPPVYDDVVSGTIVIDTARLPAYDPDLLSYEGYYVYATKRPTGGFVSGQFASSGFTPTSTVDGREGSTLSFSISNPYGEVSSLDAVFQDLGSSGVDAQGNSVVRSGQDAVYSTLGLAWLDPVPFIEVDGIALPDFTQLTYASFSSYRSRERYLVEELHEGAPGGPLLGRTTLEWNRLTSRSIGLVTSISLTVSGVPEPSSWTAMIGGFGMVGAALRRRRREATAGRVPG